MSTAGKVLSVLTLLLSAVWLLLASTVTQLNRNGGEAVQKLQADVARLDEEVTKAKLDLRALIDGTYAERLRTQSELAVLQVQQAEVEKAKAQVFDDAAHLRSELESVTKTIETAQAIVEKRTAEQEEETKAKAEAEALVEQLKVSNGELRAQLDGLNESIRSALTENKGLVERLKGGGAVPTTTRPASLVR